MGILNKILSLYLAKLNKPPKITLNCVKMNRIFFLSIFLFFSISLTQAQITERQRPAEWDSLVFGGRFMDLFLPMPDLGGMTSDTWGAPGVIPRDTNNGIEDPEWSYWGGKIRLMGDGRYHLFTCRWAENSPKGHFEWGNSIVVHAVSNNSFGPYKVTKVIGPGHNPEWYISQNGRFVIYVINGYYESGSINGPWEYKKFDFDLRDRQVIADMSNMTFAQREDESYLMICRGGGVWISKDGLSTYNHVTDSTAYPPVDGRFEDPFVWKDNVQYHMIVNDWLGRIAWYLRSKDGIHWKTDSGEAYLPGVSRHSDGSIENWFKYERIKMLQDEYGRAIQANFAVIDTLKWMDKPNDNHNSKFITIPLTVSKLMKVINTEPITPGTKEIKVLINAEEGFNPNTDIDLESLKLGAPEVVDFGKGGKLIKIEKRGYDALLTFDGTGNGINDNNFTIKLLGKDKKGQLLFAYARIPGVNYIEPILSARKPVIDSLTNKLSVDVDNFGQVASNAATIKVYLQQDHKKIALGQAVIPALQPYERKTIDIKTAELLRNSENHNYIVVINEGEKDAVTFNTIQKPKKEE